MLVVKVELHPFGDSAKAREIACMVIGNDRSGDSQEGGYRGLASTGRATAAVERLREAILDEMAGLSDGPVTTKCTHRRSDHVWFLLGRMLKAMRYVT